MCDGVNSNLHALAARVAKGMQVDASDLFLVLGNASWYFYLVC